VMLLQCSVGNAPEYFAIMRVKRGTEMKLEPLKKKPRYFLKVCGEKAEEVTKEEYVNAEARAGFIPKCEGEPATSSFGCFREDLIIEGWINNI